MSLAHPDLDFLLAVSIFAPFVYYGLKHGMAQQKKKPTPLPKHPFRRQGDEYARYFYVASKFVGPDTLVFRIPKIGGIPYAMLATLALTMIVKKGEQKDAYDRQAKMPKVRSGD
jgi:hypothetical protein